MSHMIYQLYVYDITCDIICMYKSNVAFPVQVNITLPQEQSGRNTEKEGLGVICKSICRIICKHCKGNILYILHIL